MHQRYFYGLASLVQWFTFALLKDDKHLLLLNEVPELMWMPYTVKPVTKK
jgi:hypothetical protein